MAETNEGRPDGIDADGVQTIAGSTMRRRIIDGHLEYEMDDIDRNKKWYRQKSGALVRGEVRDWTKAETWIEEVGRLRGALHNARAHVTLFEYAARKSRPADPPTEKVPQ